jgi:hypothetical protein
MGTIESIISLAVCLAAMVALAVKNGRNAHRESR